MNILYNILNGLYFYRFFIPHKNTMSVLTKVYNLLEERKKNDHTHIDSTSKTALIYIQANIKTDQAKTKHKLFSVNSKKVERS